MKDDDNIAIDFDKVSYILGKAIYLPSSNIKLSFEAFHLLLLSPPSCTLNLLESVDVTCVYTCVFNTLYAVLLIVSLSVFLLPV